MCGLTGFCDFNKKLNLTSCRNATDVLKHRGPDNGNQELFDLPHVSIGLGHRRLSILDLSANGNQPMYSENRSIAIILNGEIYNFSEIRKSLEVLGYKFYSNSDTEVIIKAYEEWGIQAVQQFIGMFAFVLVDLKKNMVYLLRDRPGVKPMYYYYNEDCILFASELKALHQYENFKKEIDHAGINFFFKYGYIPAPHTIFKNTYKLTPGNYLQINLLTKQVQKYEYWNVADHYNKPKLDISEREAEEHTEKLFTSAFEYRMVSDVPVGVFLSGGYDSSVVTAILQKNSSKKIKTFTIGFHEKKYNEAPYAKKVARYLGTEHNEYYCTTREAQDIFPLLADIYDEPFGDSSAIPTILVSRFARKQVTVALSADGGDEIFAGYNRYPQLNTINRARSMLPEILRSAISSILPVIPFKHLPLLNKKSMAFSKLEEILTSDDPNSIADTLSKHYTNKELINLLPAFNPDIKLYNDVPSVNNENDFINTLLALDYKTYMVDDILTKVDRATMSVALEGREPLLDHRIIEFVAQLPSELKYRQGSKKYLLKKIAHKYIPENLLNRPKSGFGLPVYEWFKNDLKDYLFYYINEKELAKHNLINTKYAIKIRDEFISGKNREETQIWMLLMFQMWWDRWM